jgi:hypothetical protein
MDCIHDDGDSMENGAGSAFRVYLSAIRDGRPKVNVAELRAVYTAATDYMKSVRGQNASPTRGLVQIA